MYGIVAKNSFLQGTDAMDIFPIQSLDPPGRFWIQEGKFLRSEIRENQPFPRTSLKCRQFAPEKPGFSSRSGFLFWGPVSFQGREPKLSGFWGVSLPEPPFKVTLAEAVLIRPGRMVVVSNYLQWFCLSHQQCDNWSNSHISSSCILPNAKPYIKL